MNKKYMILAWFFLSTGLVKAAELTQQKKISVQIQKMYMPPSFLNTLKSFIERNAGGAYLEAYLMERELWQSEDPQELAERIDQEEDERNRRIHQRGTPCSIIIFGTNPSRVQ